MNGDFWGWYSPLRTPSFLRVLFPTFLTSVTSTHFDYLPTSDLSTANEVLPIFRKGLVCCITSGSCVRIWFRLARMGLVSEGLCRAGVEAGGAKFLSLQTKDRVYRRMIASTIEQVWQTVLRKRYNQASLSYLHHGGIPADGTTD